MAINSNAAASLAGIFKEVYAGKSSVTDLVPNLSILAARFPFMRKDLIGNKYHMPVRVAYEHSFTHTAAGTTPTFSAATYANGVVEDAEVDGSQMIGIAAVDYEAIYKSKDPKAAFVRAAGETIKNLAASAAKRREIQILHGRKGWGVIESTSGSTLTLTAESWSNAIWAGTKGMSLNAYANDGTTARTNSAADTIASINMSTRTITVGNSVDASWVAGDYVFPDTAYGSTEFLGLSGIAASTGTLFGVAGSTYELMQGNVVDSSTGLLSMAKLMNAVGVLQSWGASGNILAIVNPKAYQVLNSDMSALRSYDKADVMGKGKNGFQGLVFNAGGNCTLEILSHPMQHEGKCVLVQEDECYRIGATDLDFIRRGSNGEEALALEVSTAAASEIRLYSNQALFVEAPRHVGLLSGITY